MNRSNFKFNFEFDIKFDIMVYKTIPNSTKRGSSEFLSLLDNQKCKRF